ncbi:4-hydroxy-tetrahydrodipicolinate synthase [Bombilactobacillus folatiphilus]|uniref:4-hydroxy-tetrahydrodipicolinate synthase n=1 Tax=Bombilactobacillus folatiphilus TaxID=2923362 RepID=A0ABY4PA88_9LACO|nr:4-hydroxy-tetrahydrodipicolinate synthase [Bombilactobacillus folatiphilus]UQS82522.1 4-hydroxy-tetrahydrodipicolinate synthase [Bombilactobacillus folatiphilus]
MFDKVELMTAIVTPFTADNQIDFAGLERLIEHLLKTGSQGFVVGGTTGETATMTQEEKLLLYRRFSEIVDGRVPVIAGTGSNNTQETITFTQQVGQIPGIDATLVVVPYYNKPDQRGMMEHFQAVADKSPVPLMIYNIPGRTGVKMEPKTVVQLAQNPQIMGIKQCCDLTDLQTIIEAAPADFLVYTGEDEQALTAKVLGAKGVISVASHLYGQQMQAMYQALEHGQIEKAGQLQRQLTPRMQALFLYPSPSGVKATLNAQGFQTGGCRLPIADLNDEQQSLLAQALQVNDLAQTLDF